MDKQVLGIHHVTAIAGDPQTNIDFYAGILGLRLVKLTVNFDDPTTYHLYYGDGQGHPGTILTSLSVAGRYTREDRHGATNCHVLRHSRAILPVLEEATGRASHRSLRKPVRCSTRQFCLFPIPTACNWSSSAPPLQIQTMRGAEDRCRSTLPFAGFHHVTLCEEGYERTASLLTETMGFTPTATSGNRFRYSTSSSGAGTLVDVVCTPAGRPGRVSVGTVHHVAWRTPTDAQQEEWQRTLTALQYNVTPIIDRKYFHSIYFREPGGVLFEIATDPPGFAVDEPAEQLGSHLVLPSWLEPARARIEQVLPKRAFTSSSPA